MIHKKIDVPIAGGLNFPLQSMVRVEQKFSAPRLATSKQPSKMNSPKKPSETKSSEVKKLLLVAVAEESPILQSLPSQLFMN